MLHFLLCIPGFQGQHLHVRMAVGHVSSLLASFQQKERKKALGWSWPQNFHKFPKLIWILFVFWFWKGLLHVYFVTAELICSPATTLLSHWRSLSAVNTCPKGWESIQAVPDTRQMWKLGRFLGQPACLSSLCKIAPCLHFFPLMPHWIHLWV